MTSTNSDDEWDLDSEELDQMPLAREAKAEHQNAVDEDKGRMVCLDSAFVRKLLLSADVLDGSAARDHMANERTFLAWSRTSLAAVGLGIAIVKLTQGPTTRESGLLFIGVGALLLFYAVARYYITYYQLKRKRFAANTWGIALVIILAVGAAVASIVLALLE